MSRAELNWSHVVLFVLHSVALLWPSEWEVISRLFIVDQAISIHCFRETSLSDATTQYTTQPGKTRFTSHTRGLPIASRVNISAGLWTSWTSLMCRVFVCSDICWECRESFLFQQQRDLREYTQATIYIRKVIEDQRVRRQPDVATQRLR